MARLQGRRSGVLAGPRAYLGPVANRTYLANGEWGGSVYTQFNSRTWHKSPQALTALQLVIGNYSASASGEAASVSVGNVTHTASIEYPAGTFTQVTFNNGSTSAVLSAGSQLLSDVVTVSIPAATKFYVRLFQTGAVGAVMSGHIDTGGGDLYEKAASGLADKTMSGTITTDGSGYAYFPLAILAMTTTPTVAIYGDSRVFGFLTTPTSGDRGDIAPAVGAASLGYLNLGVNSDTAQSFLAHHTLRLALASYCSSVVLEYGINDIAVASRSDAQVQSDLTAIAALFTQPVWLTTMEPVSTSSGDWSTLVAQTTAAYNAVRVANNNWRRGLPAGFRGYFDIADVVESARDSGLWKVSGGALTADGVHIYPAASEDVVKNSGAITTPAFV